MSSSLGWGQRVQVWRLPTQHAACLGETEPQAASNGNTRRAVLVSLLLLWAGNQGLRTEGEGGRENKCHKVLCEEARLSVFDLEQR